MRLAYEIQAADLQLTDEAQAFLRDFTALVSDRMFASRKLELQLSKLTVYPPGGKFVKHTDTPRDRLVGTVELPCYYEVHCLPISPVVLFFARASVCPA